MSRSTASRRGVMGLVLQPCLAVLAGVWISRASGQETSDGRTVAPSRSKIGIHLIGRYTPGARRIVQAGTCVLKVLDPQSNGAMLEALEEYKRRVPEGVTVVRVWENTPGLRFSPADDPAGAAVTFWQRVLQPAIRKIPKEKHRYVDYLEGPNECEHFPAWDTVDTARWYARFWVALAERIAKAGFRPCIGAIPVGNPPGERDEMLRKIAAFVPALRAAKRVGGAWSYHAYTIQYTTSVETERWYALRYRRFYEFFQQRFPDLIDMPLILTEAGVDRSGNPRKDGWQARGDADRFMRRLEWFDGELRKDRYVVGAAVFEIGDPNGWTSFDLEPVAGRLAAYIAALRPGER